MEYLTFDSMAPSFSFVSVPTGLNQLDTGISTAYNTFLIMSLPDNPDLEDLQYPTNLPAALLNHPFCYLVPKQDIAPFASPFVVTLPNDQTPLSQESFQLPSEGYDENLINELIKELDTPAEDLKYLRFKKPAIRLPEKPELNQTIISESEMPAFESEILQKIEPVTKRQLVKPDLKVKRIRIDSQPDDDEINSFINNTIDMTPKLLKMEQKIPSSPERSPRKRNHLESESNNNSPKKIKPYAKESSELPKESPLIGAKDLNLMSLNIINDKMKEIGLKDDNFDFDNNGIWISFSLNKSDKQYDYLLNTDTLHVLEENVTRLWFANSLQSIEIDVLLRIEQLSQRSLVNCTDISWSDFRSLDDPSQINELAHLGCNGCKASIILMLVLTSGRPEKQLYQETYLNSVLDFVFNLGDELLSLINYQFSEKVIPGIHLIPTILEFLSKIIELLAVFVKITSIDESIITKLEYFAFKILFVEHDPKSRHSVSVIFYHKLRNSAANIIFEVFDKNPEQHEFILNELASNFCKLPQGKIQSRQYRLSTGANVQTVTVLIIRMIQSFGIMNYKFDEQYWQLLNDTSKAAKKEKMRTEMTEGFYAHIQDTSKEITRTSNEFASLLATNLTTLLTNRKVFDNFVEDLVTMVINPEYSASETLLESIMNVMLFVCNSEKYNTNVEAYSLEIVCLIASKIMKLRSSQSPIRFSTDMSVDNFKKLVGFYFTVLVHLKSIENVEGFNMIDHFYTKFFIALSTLKKALLQKMLEDEKSEQESNRALFEELLSTEKLLLNILHDGHYVVDEGNKLTDHKEAYLQILLSQGLCNHYDNFLNLIIKSLDHAKAKSRKGAVKNLSLLIDRDPSLLTVPTIKKSIALRLNESYSSVRDSIIELLTNYVGTDPKIIDEYYVIICDRINDNSILVRKKSIALAKKMYVLTDDKAVRALVCERLLRRLDDEEDAIVDLATNTLLDVWFFALLPTNDSKHILAPRIESIVNVIKVNDKNWDYFERFFKEKVIFTTTSHEPKMKATSLIINHILEFVTQSVHIEAQSTTVENMMGLLSIIVKCEGSLISQDQLLSLQPYLTDDSSTGSLVCFYALQIFKYTLPQMLSLKPSFVSQCQLSLLKRLTKFNAGELDEAMPCLWLLSVLKKDTRTLAKACASSLDLIRPYIPKVKEPGYKPDAKIQRLLFLLGNFGRYCSFDEHKAFFKNISDKEAVTSFIVKHILIFCSKKSDENLRRVAIRNLINVCISSPTFFMSQQILKVMDLAFEEDDLKLQDVVTNGLGIFLELEEKKSIERNGLENKDSKKVKLDVQVFHGKSSQYVNDGICSSLVQRYLSPILKNCIIDEFEHSFKAIHFLQLIVKLGFANPKICIPTIIALESSQIYAIKSVAMVMHEELFEKHESLIESSYLEGLKLTVEYRRKFSNDLFHEVNFLRNMFKILQESKSSTKKLLKTINRSFSMINSSKSEEELVFAKDYIGFISVNLANLNFKTQEELLILITSIDRIIAVEGGNLSQSIQSDPKESQIFKMSLLARCMLPLIGLRANLVLNYNISPERITKFQESGGNDKDTKMNTGTLCKLNDSDLDLSAYDMNLENKTIEESKLIITEFLKSDLAF